MRGTGECAAAWGAGRQTQGAPNAHAPPPPQRCTRRADSHGRRGLLILGGYSYLGLNSLCARWILFLAHSMETPMGLIFLVLFLVWARFLFSFGGFTAVCPLAVSPKSLSWGSPSGPPAPPPPPPIWWSWDRTRLQSEHLSNDCSCQSGSTLWDTVVGNSTRMDLNGGPETLARCAEISALLTPGGEGRGGGRHAVEGGKESLPCPPQPPPPVRATLHFCPNRLCPPLTAHQPFVTANTSPPSPPPHHGGCLSTDAAGWPVTDSSS